jgi:hypothetical protein
LAALVYNRVYPASVEQLADREPAVARPDVTADLDEADPDRVRAAEVDRRLLPPTERVTAVLVASAAPRDRRLGLATVPPSVVEAVAPDALDAQLVGNSMSIRSFSPDRNRSRKRTCP